MSDSAGIEREKHMKQLKRLMEWCREAILLLNSILLWERSWYPGLIVGTTSTIFFLIWVLEPALLTIISVSLLVLALVDYLVSPLTALLCSSWTGQKERKLNEICQNLSVTLLQLQNLWRSMLQVRNDRPNLYYVGLIVCLTICIWVGNAINNLLLFYIAVNAILLMPGLRRKGRAMLSISFVRDYVSHAEKT
ncbi:ADP-ribosylation factor-like protein 6-interacting protein 1 isoform X1 [Colletes gigas]|uniref:ADP-ribosylation factor-like protein 6-interacting protein 1 isoform X1 n=1 Tax=Colletes gigas TaxID=935657 RepID=UPI001C9BB9E0|nr:ADP-ribosylation factor-like protein 6-interacting protein 1 isoform X1 [Colletes gigas]XP_043261912.1 ADP-ribosylation factor-like protein 6-interacting protein 1 isoform X1 [Colletes gigas]